MPVEKLSQELRKLFTPDEINVILEGIEIVREQREKTAKQTKGKHFGKAQQELANIAQNLKEKTWRAAAPRNL